MENEQEVDKTLLESQNNDSAGDSLQITKLSIGSEGDIMVEMTDVSPNETTKETNIVDSFSEVSLFAGSDASTKPNDTPIREIPVGLNEENCNSKTTIDIDFSNIEPIDCIDTNVTSMDTNTELSCEAEVNIDKDTECFHEFVEIARSTKPFILKNFLIGCKWSPDGTCLLTNCADYTVRLFELPKELYNKKQWNKNYVLPELEPTLKMKEGGLIYDYDWYPFMSSWTPDTCCFLTTSSKAPIHLWDAYSGKIRATYRGYNRFDEVDNAISVKFSLNGEKIYCGYKNEIKLFDVSIPGRDFTNIDTKHVAGQGGIISCIAENPAVPNMFAAGSYRRTIGLYLEDGDSICSLSGQRGGVTHLMWSTDGTYLFSGARKDNEIICWDIRNPGEVLYTLQRIVDTNQRIYFDVTPSGNYLVSGNTNGETIIWNLKGNSDIFEGKKKNCITFKSHIDCTNGVSIHKQLPLLATSSGQCHVPDLASSDEDILFHKSSTTQIENTVKLWWFGPLEPNEEQRSV